MINLRWPIELLADTNPLTAENFRALCTGEKGIGESGIPLHYKGSIIHDITTNHIWYAGDMTQGNGSGGESIYGDQFPDEECIRKHDRPGILSMANSVGRPNRRSQFLLHMKEAPDYDDEGEHVVFGQVVSGFEVISLVEQMVANEFGNPSEPVIIADCGQIFPEYVSTRVGYSGFVSESSAPAIYDKLVNQLRAAQVKMGEMEIKQAKQKIAYESESEYGTAEALRRWPWLRRKLSVKKRKENEVGKLSVKKKKKKK